MRILAVRGANLASLAKEFELNFDAEPLRSAGVFAIVGETGSGKSTILDAICLALYDKFPRVAAPGASENAPDPSGEALSAGDPRAILRRGAGRGFAEVDFIGRDGGRYRARCDLMRAHGKASGRLQNRGRSLWRIDAAGEITETLESGVEVVNRRIVELTELSFDQFRRTALLAQGEFDAFLRAEPKERAELLEKITGAEIYGRLSKRAFDRDREAQQRLAALEQRRADMNVLSAEARAAKIGEIADIETRRMKMSAERAQIADALGRCNALLQTRAKLDQARLSAEEAQRAADSLTPQRDRLHTLALLDPVLAERRAAERAAGALLEAQQEADAARIAAEQAAMEMTRAEQAVHAQAETLAAVDREVAALTPKWKEATALDARLAALAQDRARAQTTEDEIKRKAEEARDAHARKYVERQEALAALEAARADVERLAPAYAIGERWAEIDDWLEKRAALGEKKRADEKALRKVSDETTRGDKIRDAFDEADKKDAAARETLRAKIIERIKALEAFDDEGAQNEDAELARAHEALHELSRLAKSHDAARQQLTRAREQSELLLNDALTIASRITELEKARAEQSADSRDAERLGELADAAANPFAVRMRAGLVEGAPCPVCGAKAHPFAHLSGAAGELVASLRAMREATRRRLARTQDELVAAQGQAAQTQALLDDASRREEEATAALADAQSEYANVCATFDPAPTSISGATPILAAMLQDVVAKRNALVAKLTKARRLREEIDLLRQDDEQKRQALDARREEREKLIAIMRDAVETRARLISEIEGAAERIESIDRSLSAVLKICDLTPADLDRDPAGARARLQAAGEKARQARHSAETLDESLRALDLDVATLAAQASAAEEALEAAAAEVAEWDRRVDAARAQRGALLGGEATDLHRERFEEKRAQAAQAYEEARKALADANTALAAKEQSRFDCLRLVGVAGERADATRTAYHAALARAEVSEQMATSLFAISATDRVSLKREVESADAALAAAMTALAERQADCDEAEAAAPKDVAPDALLSRDAALAQEVDALSTRRGALQAEIEQDDKAGAQARDLARDIDTARADAKIWAEINAAIGSADGAKFRRFAQAVTLDELVALANQRLALLAPRYALERGGEAAALGLQIVDHDLGDERRSTRSLSGGERFLASLALALALAGLEGRDSFIDTLFIDEGFGALDQATLDVVIDALETLQGQGRRVGVISHVESLQQRIATKICVERRGGGVSEVRVKSPGW